MNNTPVDMSDDAILRTYRYYVFQCRVCPEDAVSDTSEYYGVKFDYVLAIVRAALPEHAAWFLPRV